MPLPIGQSRNLPVAALIFFLMCGTSGASAQSLGPDEAVSSGGGIAGRSLSLTPAQKSALYQAALQQRGRLSTIQIDPTIGATVSRSVELASLPDQAGIDDATDLKYAMVEGDLVIVDPIRMRVVDIIHGSTRP